MIVLVSALLGYFAHPYWIAIALRRCRTCSFRSHRHVRHGNLAGENALESGLQIRLHNRCLRLLWFNCLQLIPGSCEIKAKKGG